MAHLVGKRIEVYWDGDARFYKGRVARYAPRTGRHEVAYDDDETEWLRLDRARHRFVDGGGSRYTIEWEWADEKAQGAHAAAVAQLVAAVGATPQVASTYLDAHGSPEAAAERYLRDRDGDRPRRAARGAAPKREPATPPRRPASGGGPTRARPPAPRRRSTTTRPRPWSRASTTSGPTGAAAFAAAATTARWSRAKAAATTGSTSLVWV